MPGNDSGDRVHNFFPQDNLSQGQHHQQIVDGNWSSINNNLWVGNPGQIGLSSANTKSYNLQHSDSGKGQSSHALRDPHGLNFTQSSPRPDLSKNLSQSQQLNLNGYMYGNPVHPTRQDEANSSAEDTISDQHNLVSRGLSMYESHQGRGPKHHTKSLVRSEASESLVSFDLFGNQQQMSHPQSSMLQPLQRQQSGLGDMQQMQQQLMLRKIQELQRQQQIRQIDGRQQNAANPTSQFAKQSTGSYSSPLVNGTPNSDLTSNHLGTELGTMTWLQRASPFMQGSSNGLVFSPNQGQAHRLLDVVPQQGDQSLYGVPVSGSRGNMVQISQMAAEKPMMQQMAAFGNSLPGNQYTAFTEQASMQDELISRQRFPGENHFGDPCGQSLNTVMNTDNLQQVNPMQRNASSREIQGSHGVAAQQEKALSQVANSQNEVSLDPTEERILFGSDDNIWAAFGKTPNMSGDVGGPFDNMQSGTWSALMQSAVAEASSSDTGQQEDWSSLNHQSTLVPPSNQQPSYSEKQQTSFCDDVPSSLNSSVLPPGSSSISNNYQNLQGVHQLGNKYTCEPQGNSSQRPVRPSEEGNKWLNSGPLHNAVAEVSPMHRNVSHSHDAETNMNSISGPFTPAGNGMREQHSKPNGWNTFGSVAPCEDAAPSMHERETSSQRSQGYEQKTDLHGVGIHGDALWNSCFMPSSIGEGCEAEYGKSFAGNLQVTRDGFPASNAAGTPNQSASRFNDETSQHLSNSQLTYWKDVNPKPKSQAVDLLWNNCHQAEVKASEVENHIQKDNSTDSYRSNSSCHNSAGGLKDNGLSDIHDSRTLPLGKQKSPNQIGWRNSGPRKFQFHPMGNLEEDVERQFGKKESSHSLAMSEQSTNFGQFNSFSQIPKSSIELMKEQSADQKDARNIDDAPSRGSLPGLMQNSTLLFNQHPDMHTPSKGSQSSSQNMLELLHKVDQSRDPGSVMQFSSSGPNLSSEVPEAENSDSSDSRLQQSQSSTSQGFGLQLGPPCHQMPAPNQSFISHSSLQTANSSHQSQAPFETGEKGLSQFSCSSSVQSLPPSNERTLGEFKHSRSAIPGQAANSAILHKMPGNFSSAFNSGFPYARSQLQYPQMVRTSGQVPTNQHDAASHSMPKDDSLRGPSSVQTAQTSLSDADRNRQHDNSDSLGAPSQQIGASDQHSRGVGPQNSPTEPVPILQQPLSASGVSQRGASSKMLPNPWINVPGHPQLLSAQFHNQSSQVPQPKQAKVLESNSRAPHRQGEQDLLTGRIFSSESGASSMEKESPAQQLSTENFNSAHKMDKKQILEPAFRNFSDGYPANSASMQKDLAAFGRSLKSNNFSQQNYSLLNQMHAMKSTESDPNNRALKKMKGPESGKEAQQLTPEAAQSSENYPVLGDAVDHHTSVPSGDSKTLSFSGAADNAERNSSSQHGKLVPHNKLAVRMEDSQTNPRGDNSASIRVEHSQISPQMAPSWFSQYGTFRNGQMLATHDAQRTPIPKSAEQPFTLVKSSRGLHTLNSMEQVISTAVDTGQVGSIQPRSTPTSMAIDPQSLPLSVMRTKKRKRATFHLIPWHKELSEGSLNLQTISMAEVHWAKAANNLPKKIDDEVDLIEDGQPTLRAKRRLTLTSQLMQQLFSPPKSANLSSDADTNHESVVYSVSRLALSDACGLVSHLSVDLAVPHDGVNLISDKCKESEKVNDRHLSKVMEAFMERAQKLETDFLRLDRRASVVELRVETQENEKISVINRFAKFHGRAQADTGDTSSSSEAAGKALRPYPQRYVTALPVPRNLPDRVHCLSL